VSRRGLLIQIVGPDGAGKSTLASQLVEDLAPHRNVHHSYWRPGLLPMPGELLGKPPHIGPVTEPHSRPPHTWLKATIRLTYYAADFIVGYWMIYRPVLRRGGVVVVERGWQDLVVDSRRYLLPAHTPVHFLSILVPRPDVIVILEGPVETILQRKRELSPDEIARQLRDWKTTADARQAVVHLDARATPTDLAATLIDRLALRSSRI
jgi:thymidylate kinase